MTAGEYQISYKKRFPEKVKEAGRKYYLAHREQIRAKQNAARNPDAEFNRLLKRRYGITLIERNRILLEQEGRCAICLRHEDQFKHRLSLDHDHKTGRIRGILCSNCNRALGLYWDNEETHARFVDYLKKASTLSK